MALGEMLVVERQKHFYNVNIIREVSRDTRILGFNHSPSLLYSSDTATTESHLGVAVVTALEIAGTFGLHGLKGSVAPSTYIFYPFQHPHFSPYYLRRPMHNL